jgi:hypothetical protein
MKSGKKIVSKTRPGAGKRKSVSIVVKHFISEVDRIERFTEQGRADLAKSSRYHSWFFDYAIIRLYREFEIFIFELLIAAIHQDTTTLQESAQLSLPKRISVDVCEFLVVGHGFFDLKGRDSAISKLKKFLPQNHYIVSVVSEKDYIESLDLLFALRNFSAHNSKQSKKTALKVLVERHKRTYNWNGKDSPPDSAPPIPKNIGSSGQWLMSREPESGTPSGTRFSRIAASLKDLANAIQTKAPF